MLALRIAFGLFFFFSFQIWMCPDYVYVKFAQKNIWHFIIMKLPKLLACAICVISFPSSCFELARLDGWSFLFKKKKKSENCLRDIKKWYIIQQPLASFLVIIVFCIWRFEIAFLTSNLISVTFLFCAFLLLLFLDVNLMLFNIKKIFFFSNFMVILSCPFYCG